MAALIGVPYGTPMLHAQNAIAANDIIRRVDDHYNHLGSLRTAYTEHYSGMGVDRTETGTLLMMKPGRMRWSYTTPIGKVFILDGKFAWFYTPGDTQVSRIPAKELDDLRSPLRFLLGHTRLSKELDSLTVAPGGKSFRISGVPRGMSQRLKLLTLSVAPSGIIEGMRVEEVDGSTTEFAFNGMQENVPTRGADFTFTPPAGVAIVDGLPPI